MGAIAGYLNHLNDLRYVLATKNRAISVQMLDLTQRLNLFLESC